MTLASPLLCLPLMHKNMGCALPASLTKNCSHIWPGLPEPCENSFVPNTFPFSPQEAAACLRDIQNMGEAALSGVPVQALITPQRSRAQLQHIQEQEDLEKFIQTGQEPTTSPEASIHELRQGQKFLLWAWLMEEHLLEVQRLTENYTLSAAHLTAALEVEKDDALAGLEQIQNILSTDTFALPPWRLVVENMAFFLDTHSTAIINHPDMVEHIKEQAQEFELQDLSQDSMERYGLHNLEAQECRISLATLMQKNTSKTPAPWLEKTLHCILVKESTCL